MHSADRGLEAGEGRGIVVVEEGLDLGGPRRRRELNGNPIGDQREGGALSRGSAPRNAQSQRRSWGGRWSFPLIFLARERKLELSVIYALHEPLRGFPHEAMHLIRGKVLSTPENEWLKGGIKRGGKSKEDKRGRRSPFLGILFFRHHKRD